MFLNAQGLRLELRSRFILKNTNRLKHAKENIHSILLPRSPTKPFNNWPIWLQEMSWTETKLNPQTWKMFRQQKRNEMNLSKIASKNEYEQRKYDFIFDYLLGKSWMGKQIVFFMQVLNEIEPKQERCSFSKTFYVSNHRFQIHYHSLFQ